MQCCCTTTQLQVPAITTLSPVRCCCCSLCYLQVFNFLYSVPQLFGMVFCPRHRLPVFDPATGLLRPKDAPDWNLVNLTLQMFGQCNENTLCVRILAMQGACCALGFGVRWALAGIYK
jgi:UDP-N-acetylglucosamine--dolichyl-phosphate N-acetylglucosaminephosphotransferase